MARLSGAILGCLLTLFTLIGALGMPEFVVEIHADDATPPDIATETQTTSLASALPVAVDATAIGTSNQDENSIESIIRGPDPATEKTTIVHSEPIDNESIENETTEATVATDSHWYAFWTPFRSELAATGFMQQLQRTTGIDYRVVRQRAGAYEVAFAYDNEEDIATNIAAIRAATGLDLPDG